MIISKILYPKYFENKKSSDTKSNFVPLTYPQRNNISHFPKPYLGKNLTFKSFKIQEATAKVKGFKNIGADLLKEEDKWVDFSKVGYKHLPDIDITKVSDDVVLAYRFAMALAESQENFGVKPKNILKRNSWANKYNKYNVTKPPSVYHILNSRKAKIRFALNRKNLFDDKLSKKFEIPVFDKTGKINKNYTVFDTETTGNNVDPSKNKSSQRLDKIVSLAAILYEKGELKSKYNVIVNPEKIIPDEVVEIHGITNEMAQDKKPISHVIKKVYDKYLKDKILVAYNGNFDKDAINNAITDYNISSKNYLPEIQDHMILDPYILIQKIHPYSSPIKKLGNIYQLMFLKKLENAHDASSDAEATNSILEYCLHYLNNRRIDKSKPLTYREVLLFQNGIKHPEYNNINIKLDAQGCNCDYNYNKSLKRASVNVANYLDRYFLNKKIISNLQEEIGAENTDKLITLCTKIPKKGSKVKFKPLSYTTETAFKEALSYANIEGFNGKTKEEIEDLIANSSKKVINEEPVALWIKNLNPDDIKDGNDLFDINIARRVLKEQST